jgi:hypothetical protein
MRNMGQPRTRWFSQVLEDIKRRGKSWQEIEEEGSWEAGKDWSFVSQLL